MLRALDGLGDMLCALPALRALRHALPATRIALLTLPVNRDLFARYPGLVDELLPFPGYPGLPEVDVDPHRTVAFLAEAQAWRFELAVQLHGSGAYTNEFAVLLGATRTAGFYLPGQLCPDEELFLPYPPRGMEIHRLLALVSHLGAAPRGDDVSFPIGGEDRKAARGLLGETTPGGYAVLHSGAKDPRRRWPAERFAAVGDWLQDRGLRVVLTGAPGEAGLTARVAGAMRRPPLDLTGRTTLGSLAGVLDGARMVVTNDTGISHLAAALRVPSVVIFSASEAERWAPLDRDLHRAVDGLAGTRTPFDVEARCLGEACRLAPWNRPEYARAPSFEAVREQVGRLLSGEAHR